MAVVTKVYQGVNEFIRDMQSRTQTDYMKKAESSAWKGAADMAEAYRRVLNTEAEAATLEKVYAIVSKIDAEVHDRTEQVWSPSFAGAYPIVPDYLMGMPECMRERMPQESEAAPIRLIVETGFAGAASKERIAAYGACITALAMVLCESRPVELWVFDSAHSGNDTTNIAIKLDTSPLSIAQGVIMLADPVMGRMLALNNHYHYAAREHRCGFGLGSTGEARADKVRKVFGFDEHDIVVQTALIPDSPLMNSDPVEWVHRQLEKQRGL